MTDEKKPAKTFTEIMNEVTRDESFQVECPNCGTKVFFKMMNDDGTRCCFCPSLFMRAILDLKKGSGQ